MSLPAFRPCVLIPTYNTPATLRRVVEAVRAHINEVIVVDDGSGPEGRAEAAALGAEGLARVVHRAKNGGKGAAVKTGLLAAKAQGFTHAFQVGADGQHEVGAVPRFLAAAEAHPGALVLGAPVFDQSAPAGRKAARKITIFWVHLETGGAVIEDPMCGYRVYPVDEALAVDARGDAMDFDPEIAVRMVWRGVPVLNLPVRVRDVPAEGGGVSHFRVFWDNLAISLMHSRLMIEKIVGRLFGGRRFGPARALPPPPSSEGGAEAPMEQSLGA
jgi:glycosyltransferase involved in cell wall biosynthesis